MKNKPSLKHQIFFIYIATTVLIAGIVCFYMFFKTRDYTKNSLKNNYQNLATFMTKDIEAELDTYRSYSFILSHNPSLNQLLLNSHDLYEIVISLNTDIEPNIQFLFDSNDVIDNIVIYSDKSNTEIPSPYFDNVNKIASKNWYNTLEDIDGSITFTEDNALCVATSIRNYYSQKINVGVVKLNINLEKLTNKLLESHPNMNFVLEAEDKTLLFNSIAADANIKDYVLVNSSTLRSTTITANFFVHKSLLQIPIIQILTPVLLIVLSFLLLSQIFIYYLRKSIFQRLEQIAQHIECIDTNNFEFNITDNTTDEIGILINHINHMSIKLNNLFQELITAKENEKRAELETLRARIDPHFLYNIMDTINWIAMDKDTDLICTITYELGNYYRTCLNYGQSQCTIENEIENIRAYLKLQQIATSQGFDVNYNIDENLMRYQTCDFILQPLVENAVKHGIKPLRDRRGLITISLYELDTTIVLSVSDNGVGLSQTSHTSSFKKTHYGIQNINERIQLVFGYEYGVKIEANKNNEGTTAFIYLPKVPASSNI